jgi:hypothetical protein
MSSEHDEKSANVTEAQGALRSWQRPQVRSLNVVSETSTILYLGSDAGYGSTQS